MSDWKDELIDELLTPFMAFWDWLHYHPGDEEIARLKEECKLKDWGQE